MPDQTLEEKIARIIANRETPFLPGGIGWLLMEAANSYRADYVMSTEGDDHEPTEFDWAALTLPEDWAPTLRMTQSVEDQVREITGYFPPPT